MLVKWLDTCSAAGWFPQNPDIFELAEVESVGFLISKDERVVKLAQGISEDVILNWQCIPRACVTDILPIGIC